MSSIDMSKLSIEQKVVLHLANIGFLTSVGDITRALRDQHYAEFLVTGKDLPGLKDDIAAGILSGEIEGEVIMGDCEHESLTNEEIQQVFDNDK